MQKITPCLWFDSEAEDAAKFYVSVFPNSKILQVVPYLTETPSNKPVGSTLLVNFEINGQPFTALNGGPFFKISEAISFQVFCKDQEEIDSYWGKLSAVPQSEQCGWCKDKFGVSWQIVPENIGELVKSEKAMKVFLDMHKIDIADLEKAGE
ncbi:MAG TPA: VOC family protein [Candidatus Saccharimonadales bacterium]|nr:VOC family protein [Candidatus Saccharimonadales bacterium]